MRAVCEPQRNFTELPEQQWEPPPPRLLHTAMRGRMEGKLWGKPASVPTLILYRTPQWQTGQNLCARPCPLPLRSRRYVQRAFQHMATNTSAELSDLQTSALCKMLLFPGFRASWKPLRASSAMMFAQNVAVAAAWRIPDHTQQKTRGGSGGRRPPRNRVGRSTGAVGGGRGAATV